MLVDMVKKGKSPAGQMLIAASITESISLLMLLIAFFVTAESTSIVVVSFMVALVLGSLAAFLAAMLAIVGLVRYRQHTVWLSLILLAAIIINPLTFFMILVLSGV